MKTQTRLLGAATALCFITAMGTGTAVAAPATKAPAAPAPMASHESATVPVEGVLDDGTAFTGTLSDLTAEVVDGEVNLSGTLTGVTGDGTSVTQDFSAPITDLATPDAQGCDILNLDLGPIFLDLLGLQVDLEPIVLDVTAVPGAGNLLGNLLCAVVGLFDGAGNPLNAITNLLNRLLDGLGLAA